MRSTAVSPGRSTSEAPALAGSLRDDLRLGAPDATDAGLLDALASVHLT